MTGGGKHVKGFSHFSKNQIVNILSLIYWYLVIGYSMNVLQYCFEFIIYYVHQLFEKSWLQIQFLNLKNNFVNPFQPCFASEELMNQYTNWKYNHDGYIWYFSMIWGSMQSACNCIEFKTSRAREKAHYWYTFLKFFWSDEIVNMKVCIHTYYVRYERQWWFLIYWRYDHTSL